MAPAAVTAYIALGSNLGDRRGHLAAARAALDGTPGVAVCAVSPLFETAPVGPAPQGPYLNAAVRLETTLRAPSLLARLLEIEATRGRRRDGARHGPRTLDLDLLLFGDAELDAPELVVPHPRLHQRVFVLEPLRRIAPGVVHPILGETIEALAARAREELGPVFPAAVRPAEDPSWPSLR